MAKQKAIYLIGSNEEVDSAVEKLNLLKPQFMEAMKKLEADRAKIWEEIKASLIELKLLEPDTKPSLMLDDERGIISMRLEDSDDENPLSDLLSVLKRAASGGEGVRVSSIEL